MNDDQSERTGTATRRGRARIDRTFVPPVVKCADPLPERLAGGWRVSRSRSLGPLLGFGGLLLAARYGVGATDVLDLPGVRTGLLTAGLGDALLAVPSVSSREAEFLRSALLDERAPATLPLFGHEDALAQGTVQGLVGASAARSDVLTDSAGVVVQGVSRRELAAAQRLLLDEEAIEASLVGAAGLAGLLRFVQEDRRQPVRARRLPRALDAVVLIC